MFKRLSPRARQDLALAALLTFYLIQIGLEAFWGNTCRHLAVDYCAFWSAGRVARQSGYAAVYDLDLLRRVQSTLFSHQAFSVSPIAYLPIFLVPFEWLARLSPAAGLWAWTAFNALLLVWYLRFFVRKTTGKPLAGRWLGMFLLSLPVYWNFFNGQINVWLAICTGEFIRAGLSGRPLRGGLWLGGLLLKPQILILPVVVLVLRGSKKLILGLSVTALVVAGLSWRMIGASGFRSLAKLWLGFTSGVPTNDVGIMMNWRMVGLHLGALSFPLLGLTITVLGLGATFFAAFYLCRPPMDGRSAGFVPAVLGLLAASSVFAWHAHVHMAMILIPPLLYLLAAEQLAEDVLGWWVFLPASAYALAFLLAALVRINALPIGLGFLDFLRGAAEFGVNLYLLLWAVRNSKSIPCGS